MFGFVHLYSGQVPLSPGVQRSLILRGFTILVGSQIDIIYYICCCVHDFCISGRGGGGGSEQG